MALFLNAYQNRSCSMTVTITQSDGTNVTFSSGDVFRLKIGRGDGAAPLIELDSNAATTNGSTASAANPSTVVLDQDDLNLADMPPGIYEVEANIVDDSDQDRIKHADHGVLVLHKTQAGDVALA